MASARYALIAGCATTSSPPCAAAMLLALSDNHLQVIMLAASGLPVERRGEFLEQITVALRDTNGDLGRAVREALADVMQAAA